MTSTTEPPVTRPDAVDTEVSTMDTELDHVDGELVRLLATGATQVGAAAQLGISDRTVRRRLSDPAFRRQVAAARRDLHAESWSRLLGLRDKAGRVLEESLESEDKRLRLQAAKYIFEMGGRIRREQALDEIEERMDVLDERLDAGEEEDQT